MIAVQMARKFREQGHRVSFLVKKGSPTELALKDSGVSILNILPHGYVDPWNIRKIGKLLKKSDIDVVHAHFSRDLWVLVPALYMNKDHRTPLLLTKHIGTMKPKTDLMHRWIYNRVDVIIGISRTIQQNIIKTHPVVPDRVKCVYNGVDLDAFHFRKSDRKNVRASLKIPEDAVVVGIAGRLTWWKGYREFLEMAKKVLSIRPGIWFLAVGGGTIGEEKEAGEIMDLAKSFNLGNHLIFTGFQKNLNSFLSAMDIFVYPAYAEAFGLVLIEAMAIGLPVVSTNCDAVPEIVVDKRTGRLIPCMNSAAVTEAVMEMLEDRDKIRRFGKAGRARVRDMFDFQKMISKTVTVYTDCIDRRNVL